MAKEIVIWCERDLTQDDNRVPAREYEITIDGKTRTVDLCETCAETYLSPLLELLDEYGQAATGRRGPYKTRKKAAKTAEQPPKSAKATPQPNSQGEYECDYPGCGRAFNRPQGLGRHKLSHAVDPSGFRAAAQN